MSNMNQSAGWRSPFRLNPGLCVIGYFILWGWASIRILCINVVRTTFFASERP